MDRRGFCALAGLSLLGLAGRRAATANEEMETTAAPAPESGHVPAEAHALKTGAGARWAMTVDLQACRREEGCRDCIEACHRAHNVPALDDPTEEVKWIWKEHYAEAFPNQEHAYMAGGLDHADVLVFCNHCDNPPCVRVCPTKATWKREDGVVMMDWHRCIGCRYCVAGCPYGSRSFNWRDPRPYIDSITPDFPTRTRGVVEKCTFCDERLARGKLPACVESCTSGCLSFGDLRDADSPVRRALAERNAIRRKPGLGTDPQVYYLL